MTKDFESIFGLYMMRNPTAENPFSFAEILGLDQIERIVRLSKGNLVQFFDIIDKNGEIVPDLIVPFQEGKPLKGFEPKFEGWSILEEEEEDFD